MHHMYNIVVFLYFFIIELHIFKTCFISDAYKTSLVVLSSCFIAKVHANFYRQVQNTSRYVTTKSRVWKLTFVSAVDDVD